MDRQWIILFVVMAITLLYPQNNKYQKVKCIRRVAIALILFAGLRSWWYGDLTKYYHGFLDASVLSLKEIYEAEGFRNIGIQICFKVMYSVSGKYGYDIFIFIVSFFSIATLSKVIARFSPSPYYSYLMFICMGLYSFTYSGLKQTIAMGFCCLAMIELLDGTFKKFLFYVILGALFHAPALLFFIAWPLSRKKIDQAYFLILVIAIAVVFVCRNQIAYFLENAYYSAETAEELVSSGEAVGGRFIMMIVILLGSTFMRPPNGNDIIFSRTYSVIVLAAIFQMFSVFDNNYTRLADYFFQFITIFTSLFMEQYEYDKNGERRLYGVFTNSSKIYMLAAIVITVFSLWFYKGQIADLQNYYFFWEFDAHHWYGA